MKVMKAGYQRLIPENVTKHIERVARVCYKSEDKIGEGTDMKMIKSLIGRQHMAMLEHSSICVEVDQFTYLELRDKADYMMHHVFPSDNPYRNKYPERCYLRFSVYDAIRHRDMCDHFSDGHIRFLVSGNIRAWYESMVGFIKDDGFPKHVYDVLVAHTGGPNGVFEGMEKYDPNGEIFSIYNEDDLNDNPRTCEIVTDFTKLTDNERLLHEDVSILFHVDRGVTHEGVRMRECSFAQESTRYCNYSMGKFGSDITVIAPVFWREDSLEYHEWYESCLADERRYMHLVNDLKAQPQEARTVLPQSTKADIVITANLREWHHFLNLRSCDATGPAHPQMKEVMTPLCEDMKAWYKDIRPFRDLDPKYLKLATSVSDIRCTI